MQEKTMVRSDFFTSIFLIILGILIVANSLSMPTMAEKEATIYSAPGLVPAFIGAVLIILSFFMLLRSITKIKKYNFALFPNTDSISSFFHDVATLRIMITLALCLGYALLLGKIWFPALTILYIFFFIIAFEFDRKVSIRLQLKKIFIAFAIALVATALIAGTFRYVFLVNLP